MSLLRFGLLGLGVWAFGCTEVPRTYSTRAAEGEVIFRDAFDRTELGGDWRTTGEGASIRNGVLVVEGLRNHPVWLDRALPENVRVEFDAWAGSEEGDVKVELFGDGKSWAQSDNYIATGYVLIFGGWNNTRHVIARRNEHGRDRLESPVDPQVEPDRRYHFVITRSAGELLWEVDGKEILVYEDAHPLRGEGQDHFAFSGWEAEVHFDNLVIEAL